MRERVKQLQGWGLCVVPLIPNGKEPAGGDGWHGRAAGGHFPIHSTNNLGILGGSPVRPGYRLIIIDVDVKRGKRGKESLGRLTATYGPLPPTARAVTPTGGEHYYLLVPEDVPLGDVFSVFHRSGHPDIDCIGAGRYVVAPPSTIDGRPYEWLYWPSEGVAAAPPWLVAWLRLAGRPAALPARPEARKAPAAPAVAAAGDHHPRLLLGEIITRYPVLSGGSRNTQMSRAIASLAARGVPAPAIKDLLVQWHHHFRGRYATPLDKALPEIGNSLHTLKKKIESGTFLVAHLTDHTAEQSKRALSARQARFLARLRRPGGPDALPYHGKEGHGGGRSRLSVLEEQFCEALLLFAAYERERGRAVQEILMTNRQIMDLMRARWGVPFDDLGGSRGSKKLRRLKRAFITKVCGGKGHEAQKRELLVMVEEGRKRLGGRKGTPSRYRLTGLLDAFEERP